MAYDTAHSAIACLQKGLTAFQAYNMKVIRCTEVVLVARLSTQACIILFRTT
jgi:hypothetical protein